jgi:hypothetical protein
VLVWRGGFTAFLNPYPLRLTYEQLASIMDFANVYIEDVLRTAEMAFKGYQDATQRLASDVELMSILPTLSVAINTVKVHLEFAMDDEDVPERLKDIVVNESLFLPALNVDLRTICTYLQDFGTNRTPSKHEVDACAQALNHYSDVLKVVQKRNMRHVVSLSF